MRRKNAILNIVDPNGEREVKRSGFEEKKEKIKANVMEKVKGLKSFFWGDKSSDSENE